MNLFEMTEQAKAIMSLEDMDEQTVKDTLEGLGIEEKFASYSVVIKTINAESDAIANEIKNLQAKKKVSDNKVTRLKTLALQSLQDLGMTKGGNAIHSLTVRKGSSLSKLVEDDDATFPESYVSMVEKRDNAGLKKALKEGEEFEGFHLIDGEPSLLIK